MSSFSCPHLDLDTGWCRRLNTDCVPGRRGCVLQGKVEFVVPAEERVRALEEEKRWAAAPSQVCNSAQGLVLDTNVLFAGYVARGTCAAL